MNQFSLKHAMMAALVVLASCKKDDDQPNIPQPVLNEPESITAVELKFANVDSNHTFIAAWDDPDGIGGNTPIVDEIVLDSGAIYNVMLSFLDRSSGSTVDLTAEIEEEGNEHIVCYVYEGVVENVLEIASTDTDGRFSIGLETLWLAKNVATGELTLTLKHQPDGLKDGSCDPGETDVEVVFPISIQ